MKALIMVDIQNDFLPGGPLAAPKGDEVIPVANRVQQHFPLVVATQDWHPANHGSFADNHPGKEAGETIELDGVEQILWPVHCVQGTTGAEFASDLATRRVKKVFRKGTDRTIDSYSGFFDNARKRDTGLGDYLKEQGVTEVYILGLATDYCVKSSALDAVDLGFNTFVIEDGCRGVNMEPDDVSKAIKQMQEAGVTLTTSEAVAKQ